MVAFMADRHDTVGVDLVAMSVNDILVMARAALLPRLLATKLDASTASKVVKGSRRLQTGRLRPIGGETAEMPGLYKTGEYDLAGFAVGVVDRKRSSTASA